MDPQRLNDMLAVLALLYAAYIGTALVCSRRRNTAGKMLRQPRGSLLALVARSHARGRGRRAT
jgi:hypothetical protein